MGARVGETVGAIVGEALGTGVGLAGVENVKTTTALVLAVEDRVTTLSTTDSTVVPELMPVPETESPTLIDEAKMDACWGEVETILTTSRPAVSTTLKVLRGPPLKYVGESVGLSVGALEGSCVGSGVGDAMV